MIGTRGGGRPRKPLVVKGAEGDAAKVGKHKLARMLRDEEERYTPGEPKMPEFMSKEAKREWRRMVPLLLQGRVLSESEGVALGSLCQDIATMTLAQLDVQKRGLIVRVGGPDGELRVHPLLAVIDKLSPRVTVGLREFGLTPASRSRAAVVSPKGDAELFEILSRPLPQTA